MTNLLQGGCVYGLLFNILINGGGVIVIVYGNFWHSYYPEGNDKFLSRDINSKLKETCYFLKSLS